MRDVRSGRRSETTSKRIVIDTTPWCPDGRAAKKLLTARGVPFEEIDIGKDPEGAGIVMKLNDGLRKVPALDIEGTIVSGGQFDPSRFEKDLRDAGAM